MDRTVDVGVWRPALAYRRARVLGDMHFYQKWRAVWPALATLPRSGVRLLDAGCGDGRWAIEIALRRPGWDITGVDINLDAIVEARRQLATHGVPNVTFLQADFAAFQPGARFDAILSVCATHYGATVQDTGAVFQRLGGWLSPAGRVFLLVPRSAHEAPFSAPFTRPTWHDRYTRQMLMTLCAESHMTAERLVPCVGRLGTMAKQLDWARPSVSRVTGAAFGAAAKALALVGAHVPVGERRSLMWLLIARTRTDA